MVCFYEPKISWLSARLITVGLLKNSPDCKKLGKEDSPSGRIFGVIIKEIPDQANPIRIAANRS